ncbi:hypothetical protein [Streptomyces sp. NPDC059708]|uniref:hypothetical protein n=1 Tax=Streptomyces sp. NPDC059708 TaxID=3346916 RepID=UPI0036B96CE5
MAVVLEVPRARRSGGLGLSTAVRMPAAIRAAAENYVRLDEEEARTVRPGRLGEGGGVAGEGRDGVAVLQRLLHAQAPAAPARRR